MLEPLTLSTGHRKVISRVALFLVVVGLSSGCIAESALNAEDLCNLDKLLAYRQNVSKDQRGQAEKMYQHALQATEQDSASAVKGFGESALIYPSSPALMGLAEHRAKMLAKKDEKIKRAALGKVVHYLASAERLNAADKMLTKAEQNQLVQDKACTEQYLANKPGNAVCRPVQWIGLR